jgi:hypothetical protein
MWISGSDMTNAASSSLDRWFKDDRVFAGIVTLSFMVLTAINIHHHVMWRDEVRSWQVVIISPSFAALRQNLRYFGVPILWYLLLWWVSFFFHGIGAMQGLHVAIATAVVFVFAWRAPFGKVIRALFPFGYYTLFEYGVISRNYSLLFLFVLIAAAIIALPAQRPLALALSLFLLAQVSVWGIAFAGLILLVGIFNTLLAISALKQFLWRRWVVAAVIVLAGCILGYVEAQPSPGASFIAKWGPGTSAAWKVVATLGTIWKGWFPIPEFTRHFWNTNILDQYMGVQCGLGCALFCFAALALLRRPAALLMFLGGTLGLMAFTYLMFVGVTRHNGQLFIVLIAALWIAARSPEWVPTLGPLRLVSGWLDRKRCSILCALLVVQLVTGVGVIIADARMPFSAGKAVAEYIRHNVASDVTIMAIDDYCADPVSAYLQRDFYYPQMRAVAPYNTQDDAARYPVSLDSLFDEIRLQTLTNNRDVLLLLSSGRTLVQQDTVVEMPATAFVPREVFQIRVLPTFTDSTVQDESQSLYLIHRLQ